MTERLLDHRDVTLQAVKDYGRQLERALDGLEIEEARWMPTPDSNHILWILWHMARMGDHLSINFKCLLWIPPFPGPNDTLRERLMCENLRDHYCETEHLIDKFDTTDC